MATTKTVRLAAMCAIAVALSGCSTSEPLVLDTDTAQSGRSQPFKSVPVAERADAPEFSGSTVDEDPVRLSDYRGKVVVVNAWATWCGPCRAESPALERTYQKFKDQGVQVLGISTDVKRQNARAFQREFALSYPSLHDPDGRQFLKLPRGMVNPQFLPFTLFVDREGRIAGAVQAPLTEKELQAILTPILKETSGKTQE
ncbi:TlpA family protein disulfide reductase [Streptomyces europaeiscabiei]|uniref:TlpA disulfide reductase family protein n=1 Tax=Streptomyces europaeiscabiei TaxID=146819 RepID=A0ABU4NJ37_9ACTN|nr:TlpA disulfide reductase family protein [Streptomyces europaeiscabiei]MDX2764633.1 TlpA disulfide reductase family protein [Streptomyces europaeiscabiei]MDX2773136.1 TlpA disulfide reductase family protein [Streptomyces europaeiscabiei]MDX3545111.1 TlpA disulfide reductase family protein [Streptomyces europaeiscabiei]MDX3554799.1 TlpA disulfide reductase family protein [Streptomyces europaeiscabiei]MDX3671784.1 TlpA disulfide reductase family protein [Streptomyces europaeiscabiei]